MERRSFFEFEFYIWIEPPCAIVGVIIASFSVPLQFRRQMQVD